MSESTSGIIRVPEDSPDTFECVVHFLHHGNFEVDMWQLADEESIASGYHPLWWDCWAELEKEQETLVHVYLFADKVLAEDLQNAAFDGIQKGFRHIVVEPWMVKLACCRPKDDKLRGLIQLNLACETLEQGCDGFRRGLYGTFLSKDKV